METHLHERARPHTCPFCHDELGGQTWTCPACHTAQHLECARENRRCTSLGCAQLFVEKVEPAAAGSRPGQRLYRALGPRRQYIVTSAIALLPLLAVWLFPGVVLAIMNRFARGVDPVQRDEVLTFTLLVYALVVVNGGISVGLSYLLDWVDRRR
jgi:hypothetical protein